MQTEVDGSNMEVDQGDDENLVMKCLERFAELSEKKDDDKEFYVQFGKCMRLRKRPHSGPRLPKRPHSGPRLPKRPHSGPSLSRLGIHENSTNRANVAELSRCHTSVVPEAENHDECMEVCSEGAF